MPVAHTVAFAWHNHKQEAMKIFKLLLDADLDVNEIDDYGISMLHWAAGFDCSDLVRFLLENTKMDAQLKVLKNCNSFKVGETALDFARRMNHHEIVSIFKQSKMCNQVL